ncbi:MAG: hypothetical protein EA367_14850 [Leptolyngbya sp. DLM2.Bin15]|nr:MAG: hypothetical protein EA367_14850 [Leptolyngbya sp. DLM2.Bin15]
MNLDFDDNQRDEGSQRFPLLWVMGLWQEVVSWGIPTMEETCEHESYVNIQEGFGYIGVTRRENRNSLKD